MLIYVAFLNCVLLKKMVFVVFLFFFFFETMAIFLLLLNAEPLQYVIIEVQDIF